MSIYQYEWNSQGEPIKYVESYPNGQPKHIIIYENGEIKSEVRYDENGDKIS